MTMPYHRAVIKLICVECGDDFVGQTADRCPDCVRKHNWKINYLRKKARAQAKNIQA